MKDRLLHTPEGVRDIYNSECRKKHLLEQNLKEVMHSYGFEDIETPTFEFFEIFSAERGTVKAKDMYKFFDREGNTLVLRPDITPAIARCAAKYYSDESMPIRLCYCENTFINSSEYQLKQKEVTQIGCELINDAGVTADAEVIAVTVESLLKSGLTEFRLDIGDVRFFKALISEAGFDEEKTEVLRHLIIDKNTFGLEDFLKSESLSEELKVIFTRLPQLFGSFDKLEEIRRLTGNADALAAIDHLVKLYDMIKLYGYEKYIGFDLGMLSKYSYYTGIIFQAFTYGIGEPVATGGRYDKLVGQFGKNAAAVGAAIITDRIMMALQRQGISSNVENSIVIVCAKPENVKEAVKKCIELRKAGKNVISFVEDDLSDEKLAQISKDKINYEIVKVNV